MMYLYICIFKDSIMITMRIYSIDLNCMHLDDQDEIRSWMGEIYKNDWILHIPPTIIKSKNDLIVRQTSAARILLPQSCVWEEGLTWKGVHSAPGFWCWNNIRGIFSKYIEDHPISYKNSSWFLLPFLSFSAQLSLHLSLLDTVRFQPAIQHHLVEELHCTWPRQLNPCLWQRFATNEGLQAICFPS